MCFAGRENSILTRMQGDRLQVVPEIRSGLNLIRRTGAVKELRSIREMRRGLHFGAQRAQNSYRRGVAILFKKAEFMQAGEPSDC